MDIIVFFIFKLIFVSIVYSQTEINETIIILPTHVCKYEGSLIESKIDHPISITDVPGRCNLITYGSYNIDETGNEFIIPENLDAINKLIEFGFPVYIYVGYSSDNKWHEILDPQNSASSDKFVTSLTRNMNKFNITGITLGINNVYINLTDCDQKITAFVKKIKDQLPALQIALNIKLIDGDSYKKIPNKALFDFSVTNSVIDLYFIDLTVHKFVCTPQLHDGGTVLTSPDKNVPSVELLSNVVSQSTMDKKKIIAIVNIAPLSKKKPDDYVSMSEYCSASGPADSPDWCVDKLQRKYDIGALVKKYFAGVAVNWIELDDVNGLCKCQEEYPVTNAIFDGWDGIPIKHCQKLD